MGREIERKFLVTGEDWRPSATGSRQIRQAYLTPGGPVQLRVRIADGREAKLTVKSTEPGRARAEFEYAIPLADAEELMLSRVGNCIEKERFLVPAGGDRQWEVDVFSGVHEGLVIAEIELGSEDEEFARPGWLGQEVTDDPAYYNASLAMAEPVSR